MTVEVGSMCPQKVRTICGNQSFITGYRCEEFEGHLGSHGRVIEDYNGVVCRETWDDLHERTYEVADFLSGRAGSGGVTISREFALELAKRLVHSDFISGTDGF